MISSVLAMSIFSIIVLLAAFFQILTLNCVSSESVRAAKMLSATGFFILFLRFVDLLANERVFEVPIVPLLAVLFISAGPIVGNIERIMERKERKKHEPPFTAS